MMTPAKTVIDEARALVGVPWRHQGRATSGVDCIGLVVLALERAGVDVERVCGRRLPITYRRQADPQLYELVSEFCERIAAPIPGCLILFKFEEDKHPRHFGIYTDRDSIIHAEAKTRRHVIEHGYRAHWLRRTHSAWKLPGVIYE